MNLEIRYTELPEILTPNVFLKMCQYSCTFQYLKPYLTPDMRPSRIETCRQGSTTVACTEAFESK